MNSSPLTKSLSVSVRVYRALLVAYPKKFREDYETQMMQVFRESIREAYHHRGMSGMVDLWFHTFADLLVTALMERIMEGSQHMFSPRIILWGGLASLFGGLFWLMIGIGPSSGGAAFGLPLALALGLGGLIGLYSLQAGQGGRLGLAGFALGIIGTVLVLATLCWAFTSGHLSPSTIKTEPVLAAPGVLSISLGIVTLGIGLALLGITSLRAKTLHRWRDLPLGLGLLNAITGMASALAYYVPLSQGRNPWDPWNPGVYVPPLVVFVLLGLGWMALGITLATEADTKVAQPPPASA